jgi:hypothetical protein
MPLLTEAFAHKGAAVGLVTTKCLDDGSTSPFVARWGDRYDLRNVAARVDGAFRSKTFVHGVGGFSNELRKLRRRPDDDFVFTTDGESVFARRCEYASSGEFETLAVRALERLVAKSPEEHLLVLVHTDVDRAGHAHDRKRLEAAVNEISSTVKALLSHTNDTIPVILFGAHDTGGFDKETGFRIVGRAPQETAVPYMIEVCHRCSVLALFSFSLLQKSQKNNSKNDSKKASYTPRANGAGTKGSSPFGPQPGVTVDGIDWTSVIAWFGVSEVELERKVWRRSLEKPTRPLCTHAGVSLSWTRSGGRRGDRVALHLHRRLVSDVFCVLVH